MRSHNYFTLTLFLVLAGIGLQAQSYTAQLIDVKSKEPIPFATLKLAENKGTISNAEGVFSISLEDVNTFTNTIEISSIGYESLILPIKKPADTIITLSPSTTELSNVFLTNNPLEAEEIIDRIKENILKNYPSSYTQKKIFFRTSLSNTMDEMKVEVEKTSIPEFNQQLMDSILSFIPRQSDVFTEALGTLSGTYQDQKFFTDKAAQLYDKSKEGANIEEFGKRLESIIKKNVKEDSYFKIKSGLLGTTVDPNEEDTGDVEKGIKIDLDTDENAPDTDVTESVKNNVKEMYEGLFFLPDSKLDILDKSNRYRFSKEGFTTIDGTPAYIIHFEPKGRKDFKGTFYVNIEDFAVMRLDFENVRNISSFGLFGISYKAHRYRGKSIFSKDEDGGYSLRYMEIEKGVTFGLDRPLTIIEKNKNVKGRRKQNEVDMELDFAATIHTKKEFVVYNSQVIDEVTYKSTSDSKDVKATYLPSYDPTFWEGYTIMEPNKAIQDFKSVTVE